MENILSLFKEKKFSREEVESILFNPYGLKETGKNISNDKFLLDRNFLNRDTKFSERTYYDWKNGEHFPQLDIIFLMAQILQKPVESIFIYDYIFVESLPLEKSKDKNEKGTMVHSVKKSIYFERILSNLARSFPIYYKIIDLVYFIVDLVYFLSFFLVYFIVDFI